MLPWRAASPPFSAPRRTARSQAYYGEYPAVLAARASDAWWSCERDAVDAALLGAFGEQAAALPRYFSTYSEHVARLLPDAATRVLDVGCGAGLFLKAVKERRPDLVVEGVEPDGFAALAAAQHLDRVYEGAAPRGRAFPRRPARAIARVQARPRPSRTTSTTARTTRSC